MEKETGIVPLPDDQVELIVRRVTQELRTAATAAEPPGTWWQKTKAAFRKRVREDIVDAIPSLKKAMSGWLFECQVRAFMFALSFVLTFLASLLIWDVSSVAIFFIVVAGLAAITGFKSLNSVIVGGLTSCMLYMLLYLEVVHPVVEKAKGFFSWWPF